jgi:hypothetical protein
MRRSVLCASYCSRAGEANSIPTHHNRPQLSLCGTITANSLISYTTPLMTAVLGDVAVPLSTIPKGLKRTELELELRHFLGLRFLVHFVSVRLSCGGVMHSYFTVGPSRQRRGTRVLFRRAGSSGISWHILSLVKMALHRHHSGFEPQRASPFRYPEKPPKPERLPLFLCYPSHCWWCWRALPAAICNRCALHTTTPSGLERAGTAGKRFARDDKELGPQLGKTIIQRKAP